MYHHCMNLHASEVQWSPSIIVCYLHITFISLYQQWNKVQVSTPASKDINAVIDVHVIKTIRTMIYCHRRHQTVCHNAMLYHNYWNRIIWPILISILYLLWFRHHCSTCREAWRSCAKKYVTSNYLNLQCV